MAATRTVCLIAMTLVALLVMPAGAYAAAEFEAEEYPVEVTGVQTEGSHVLGVEGGLSVVCEEAKFKGSMDGWSETEELAPEYKKCTASGFAATITTNGCVYKLHAGEPLAEEGDFEGTTDLVCPTGNKIVVVAGTCEVQIAAQTGLGKIEYDDNPEATPDNVAVSIALTGVKYNKTKDGFLCPLSGTGEKSDGTYNGNVLATGELLEEQKGVAVNKPPKTKLCKQKPNPVCPELLPAGSKLEAVGSGVSFVLKDAAGNIKNRVKCSTERIKAETEAAEGLPVKNVKFLFENCETEPNKTKCTNPSTETPTGLIRWNQFHPFSGALYISTFVVKLECKGELKCEYVAAPVSLYFFGGPEGEAALSLTRRLSTSSFLGEENCPAVADTGFFSLLVEPKGIWIIP
jgi:hypothetical protein